MLLSSPEHSAPRGFKAGLNRRGFKAGLNRRGFGGGRPEPIILKKLPIILSGISQNFP